MPGQRFGRDALEADALHLADRALEVALDHVAGQADGLEDLGARIGRHRRDAHFGHGLEDAFAGRLHVVVQGLAGRHARDGAPAHLVDHGVEGEVGVDGGRAVTDQAGQVVDGAGFARLDDEAHPGPQFLVHQEMMDGGDEQQGRDRGRRRRWRGGPTAPRRWPRRRWLLRPGRTPWSRASRQALARGGRRPWRRTARRGRRCASPAPARPRPRTAGWPARRWSVPARGSLIWWQDPGPGASRLPSGPTDDDSEVMSSSLMASRGGLVTWAKSWRK